jgi:hypothetical protein
MTVITEKDSGREVAISLEEKLEVVLSENPTTGYLWRLARTPYPACECSDLLEDRSKPGRRHEPVFVEPDTILAGLDGRIGWYHFNRKSVGPALIAKLQGLSEYFENKPDPLLHRIFGAVVTARGGRRIDAGHLASPAGRSHRFSVFVLTEHPSSPEKRLKVPVHVVRADRYMVPAKPVGFTFDRNFIDSKGRLQVVIERTRPDSVLGISFEGCLVLYARPGSFDVNFFTALVVIFFQIVLITAISVASSTSLSWPVSILVSFFVFFCGQIIDIMRNAADILGPHGHQHGLAEDLPWLHKAFNGLIEVILGFLSYVLPDFRKFEVCDDVIHNRAIAGISITGAILYSATYVAIAFVVGYILFRRREIE